MKRIFISYKSEDFEYLKNLTKKIYETSPEVKISTMRKSKNWKKIAKKLLSKSDIVIYLAGDVYSDNIDWEINTAIKMGHKVYCVTTKEGVKLNNKLLVNDGFDPNGRGYKVQELMSVNDLSTIIKGDRLELQNLLFNNVENTDLIIEQYKLLLGTTETLIERRQKLTTTYISVFSLLLPMIGTLIALDYYFLYIAVIIISLISIVICFSWYNTIISYGKSNLAKFTILEEIEHKLPINMFSSEWYTLRNLTSKYKSFTSRETILPILFGVVYSIFAVLGTVLYIVEC